MRQRGWLGIVFVSILGHVALFWPGVVMHSPTSGAEALNVTLVEPLRHVDPLRPVAPMTEAQRAGLDARAGLQAREAGRKMGSLPASGQEAGRPGSSGPVGLPDGGGVMMKRSDQEPQVPAEQAEGQSRASTLEAYRFALAREVLRIQRYPAQLLDRAQGGIVELEVRFPDAGSSQPLISVLASSGRQLLDEAALGAMREGVRNIPFPGLHGAVRLSVLFEADGPAP